MKRDETQPTSHYTEAIAGIKTFFTMAYIVLVNPAILSTPCTGMNFGGVLTATVLPVFLTIILIPLTYSIAQGILWGFISYVSLYLLLAARRGEIHPVMYALALVSVGLLLLEHGKFS